MNLINNILQNPRSPQTLDVVGGGYYLNNFFKITGSCNKISAKHFTIIASKGLLPYKKTSDFNKNSHLASSNERLEPTQDCVSLSQDCVLSTQERFGLSQERFEPSQECFELSQERLEAIKYRKTVLYVNFKQTINLKS